MNCFLLIQMSTVKNCSICKAFLHPVLLSFVLDNFVVSWTRPIEEESNLFLETVFAIFQDSCHRVELWHSYFLVVTIFYQRCASVGLSHWSLLFCVGWLAGIKQGVLVCLDGAKRLWVGPGMIVQDERQVETRGFTSSGPCLQYFLTFTYL